jgi:hypothetical protein
MPAPEGLVRAVRYRVGTVGSSATDLEEYVFTTATDMTTLEASRLLLRLEDLVDALEGLYHELWNGSERKERARAR